MILKPFSGVQEKPFSLRSTIFPGSIRGVENCVQTLFKLHLLGAGLPSHESCLEGACFSTTQSEPGVWGGGALPWRVLGARLLGAILGGFGGILGCLGVILGA